jgi:hypothetical protein
LSHNRARYGRSSVWLYIPGRKQNPEKQKNTKRQNKLATKNDTYQMKKTKMDWMLLRKTSRPHCFPNYDVIWSTLYGFWSNLIQKAFNNFIEMCDASWNCQLTLRNRFWNELKFFKRLSNKNGTFFVNFLLLTSIWYNLVNISWNK